MSDIIGYLNTLYDCKKKEIVLYYLLKEENKKKRNIFINLIKGDEKLYKVVRDEIERAEDAWFFKDMCQGHYAKCDNDEEVKESYNKLLSNYISLSHELGFSNPIEQVIFYSYLLWEGYFSYDKTNRYQIKGRNLKISSLSYDIMRGIGVCINFSNLLNDYLNMCGIDNAVAAVMPLGGINRCDTFATMNESKPIIDNNFILNFIHHIRLAKAKPEKSNHVFNIIGENNKLYAYDPTNLLLLELKKNYTANVVNGNGTFKIFPSDSYLFSLNERSINLLDKYMLRDQDYTSYDFMTYRKIRIECRETIKGNLSLVNDAYDTSYLDILTIADYARNFYDVKERKMSK